MSYTISGFEKIKCDIGGNHFFSAGSRKGYYSGGAPDWEAGLQTPTIEPFKIAYKHNAIPMILGAFLPNGLQNDQETPCFIRVPVVIFAVCEITSFPKECKGFSTCRVCITECL